MARLEKFRGTDSLPGVRRPQVVADTAVGAATQNLGAQIRQSAKQINQLGQLLAKRQDETDTLELDRARRKFEAGLRQKETRERQARQLGATGFTEIMLGHFEADGQAAIDAQPERLQARLAGDLESQRDLQANRFAALEYEDNLQYFRDGLAEALQAQVANIDEDPGSVETGQAALSALLDRSPLGRSEREIFMQATKHTLGEAWMRTLPPQRRLDLLDGSRAGDGSNADPETPGSLSALPFPTRDRLRVEALDELSGTEVRETAELAARIKTERSGFDPQLIEASQVLPPESKTQLRALMADERLKEEDELAALGWARSPAPGNPHSEGDRRLADRAFLRLTAKGTDPDIAAQVLFRNKRVVPKAFTNEVLNQVRSQVPERVREGYERLGTLAEVGGPSFRFAAGESHLQDSLAKWRILTEVAGHDADEAARKLASANDPAIRDRLSGQSRHLPESDAETVLELLASQPSLDGLG